MWKPTRKTHSHPHRRSVCIDDYFVFKYGTCVWWRVDCGKQSVYYLIGHEKIRKIKRDDSSLRGQLMDD